jgi:hypothetical protein
MDGLVYPAASTVAPTLREHFLRLVHDPNDGGSLATAVPDLEAIEHVINAAFWASLRREEGYIPKISLALVPPEDTVQPMFFERSLPLTTTSLVKVAPAVERPGIHLGVWGEQSSNPQTLNSSTPQTGLRVWGTVRRMAKICLVLEVAGPGLLVVKHQRSAAGKFVNVAVLEGDQIKIIDEDTSSLPDCPSLLTSLLGFESRASWNGSIDILVQLSASMRAHGRGGALLVVPAATNAWTESVVQPVPYAVSPPFSELADLVRVPSTGRDRGWQDALDDAVQAIAGLTAVDGATILSDRYELLTFGAKLVRRRGTGLVERVALTEPIQGGAKDILHPNRLGGTRHLSAAQFVHDQRDAVALVASQDGRFTIFAWSPCEDLVHAHRVEALLL